jgi:N-acetylglucosaminyldiphosphoundecaprenol N-acetyl-beta-D-mannosaminyltransferase
MRSVDVLSIPVNTGSYRDFLNNIVQSAVARESSYACIANVHTVIEARADSQFASVVSNARYVTPDGQPLAWAIRMLYGIKQDRVAGMDLLPDLLEECAHEQIPIFFYGGTADLLEKTKEYLYNRYPNLIISGMYSPPFRTLNAQEETQVIQTINESRTKLVFVVLGCPKQEKWMASMRGKIHAVTVGVGGALKVLIGDQRRAPRWMQHYGMEWAFRLLQEPHRLFRRYAVTNSVFLYLIAVQYVKLKILHKHIRPGQFETHD